MADNKISRSDLDGLLNELVNFNSFTRALIGSGAIPKEDLKALKVINNKLDRSISNVKSALSTEAGRVQSLLGTAESAINELTTLVDKHVEASRKSGTSDILKGFINGIKEEAASIGKSGGPTIQNVPSYKLPKTGARGMPDDAGTKLTEAWKREKIDEIPDVAKAPSKWVDDIVKKAKKRQNDLSEKYNKEAFGNTADKTIDEALNSNIVKQGMKSIADENVRNFVYSMLSNVTPEAFYKKPASSTLQHHLPVTNVGEGGLLRHTFLSLETFNDIYKTKQGKKTLAYLSGLKAGQEFTPEMADLTRAGLVLHDIGKYGMYGEGRIKAGGILRPPIAGDDLTNLYTAPEHALYPREMYEKLMPKHIKEAFENKLGPESINKIFSSIETHMGEFHPGTPFDISQMNAIQSMVHLFDFIGSRNLTGVDVKPGKNPMAEVIARISKMGVASDRQMAAIQDYSNIESKVSDLMNSRQTSIGQLQDQIIKPLADNIDNVKKTSLKVLKKSIAEDTDLAGEVGRSRLQDIASGTTKADKEKFVRDIIKNRSEDLADILKTDVKSIKEANPLDLYNKMASLKTEESKDRLSTIVGQEYGKSANKDKLTEAMTRRAKGIIAAANDATMAFSEEDVKKTSNKMVNGLRGMYNKELPLSKFGSTPSKTAIGDIQETISRNYKQLSSAMSDSSVARSNLTQIMTEKDDEAYYKSVEEKRRKSRDALARRAVMHFSGNFEDQNSVNAGIDAELKSTIERLAIALNSYVDATISGTQKVNMAVAEALQRAESSITKAVVDSSVKLHQVQDSEGLKKFGGFLKGEGSLTETTLLAGAGAVKASDMEDDKKREMVGTIAALSHAYKQLGETMDKSIIDPDNKEAITGQQNDIKRLNSEVETFWKTLHSDPGFGELMRSEDDQIRGPINNMLVLMDKLQSKVAGVSGQAFSDPSFKINAAIFKNTIDDINKVMTKGVGNGAKTDFDKAKAPIEDLGKNFSPVIVSDLNSVANALQRSGGEISKYEGDVTHLANLYNNLGKEMSNIARPESGQAFTDQKQKIEGITKEILKLESTLTKAGVFNHFAQEADVAMDATGERARTLSKELMSALVKHSTGVFGDYNIAMIKGQANAEEASLKKIEKISQQKEAQLKKDQAAYDRAYAKAEKEYAQHMSRMGIVGSGGPSGPGTRVQSMFNKAFQVGGALAGFGYYYTAINIVRQVTAAMTEYEETLARIQRVMDRPANPQAFEKQRLEVRAIGAELRNLQVQYGMTIKEIGSMTEEWSKSGYQAKDELMGLTKVSAELFKVGDFQDGAEAVKLLNATLAQYGVAKSEAGKVGQEYIDAWSKLADQIPADTKDFANAFARTAKYAQGLGISFHELNTIVSLVLERTGRSGREVGTALQSIFTFITRPKSIETLQKFGVEVFADKAKARFRDFTDILLDLNRVYKALDATQSSALVNELAAAVGMTRRKNMVIALMDSMTEYNERLKISVESAGYNAYKVGLTMEAAGEKIKVLKAAFQNLATSAGEAELVPVLNSITGGLTDMMQAFTNADPSIQRTIITLGLLMATIKGLGAGMSTVTGAGWLGTIGQSTRGLSSNLPGADFVANQKNRIATDLINQYDAMYNIDKNKLKELDKETLGFREHFVSSVYTSIGAVQKEGEAAEKTSKQTQLLNKASKTGWALELAYSAAVTAVVIALAEGAVYLATYNKRKLEAVETATREIIAEKEKVASLTASVRKYEEIEAKLASLKEGTGQYVVAQGELASVQREIAQTLPDSITAYDEDGKSKATNIELTRALIKAEKDLLDLKAMEAGSKYLDEDLNELKKRKQSLEIFREDLLAHKKEAYENPDKGDFNRIVGRLSSISGEMKAIDIMIGARERLEEAIYSDTSGIDYGKKEVDNFIDSLNDTSAPLKEFLKGLGTTKQSTESLIEEINGASNSTDGLSSDISSAGIAMSGMNPILLAQAMNYKDLTEFLQKYSSMSEKQKGSYIIKQQMQDLEAIFPGLISSANQGVDALSLFVSNQADAVQSAIDDQYEWTNVTIDECRKRMKVLEQEAAAWLIVANAFNTISAARSDLEEQNTFGYWSDGISFVKNTVPVDYNSDESKEFVKDKLYNQIYWDTVKGMPWLSGQDRLDYVNSQTGEAMEIYKSDSYKGMDKAGVSSLSTQLANRASGLKKFVDNLNIIQSGLESAVGSLSSPTLSSGAGSKKDPFDDFNFWLNEFERNLKSLDRQTQYTRAQIDGLAKVPTNIPKFVKLIGDEEAIAEKKSKALVDTNKSLNKMLGEYQAKLAAVWNGQTAWNSLSDDTKESISNITQHIDTLNDKIAENERAQYESQKRIRELMQETGDIYKSAILAEIDLVEKAKNKEIEAIDDKIKALETENKVKNDLIDDQQKDADRAEETRKYNNKIADLDKEIKYHQIRTGREHADKVLELQKQKDEEIKAWSKQQDDWARDDQKDANNKELEEQKNSLEAQKEQLNDFYDELKNIMSDSAIDILALASAYDDKYYKQFKSTFDKALQYVKEKKLPEAVQIMKDWNTVVWGSGGYESYDPFSTNPNGSTTPGGLMGDKDILTQGKVATISTSDNYYAEANGVGYMWSRRLAELLGLSVGYDSKTNKAVINGVGFSANRDTPFLSEEADNGRYWVKLRDAFSSLGYKWRWLNNSIEVFKAHSGADVMSEGMAILNKGEKVLAPSVSVKMDKLLAIVDRVKSPEVNKESIQNYFAFYAPLFNSENTVVDKEIDMNRLGTQLMTAVKGLANGRGGNA